MKGTRNKAEPEKFSLDRLAQYALEGDSRPRRLKELNGEIIMETINSNIRSIDISKDFDLIKVHGDIKIETPSAIELIKHPLGFAAVIRSSMVLCMSNRISYTTKIDILKTFFRLQMEMDGICKCPELFDVTKEDVENFRFTMEHGQGSAGEVLPKVLASLSTFASEK